MSLAGARNEELRAPCPGSAPQDRSLADGLRQRLRLFELILADLVGPRTVLSKDLLPVQFVPERREPADQRGLRAYAAELVRCPDGMWRVAADLVACGDNDPGAKMFEGAAMAAFLPGLCRFLLGEPLRLASVPSRWLADPGALQEIVTNLHRWAIVDALARGPAIRLATMTRAQRAILQHRVGAAPWRFAARLLVEGEAAFVAMTRSERGAWRVTARDAIDHRLTSCLQR